MIDEDRAWVEYRSRFSEVYDDSNYASPLQSMVMRASHRLIEKKYQCNSRFSQVLEIGAGTGEHLAFVKHGFDEYTLADMDPAALDIARIKLAKAKHQGIKFEVQTADSLEYVDSTFDRVVATHVLEHIYHPHVALKEWARVVKNGGVLSILIPTDPGVAWRLGRHLGPRSNSIKKGIAYDYVMAREHVNSCNNLVAILRHYFPERTESWWPTSIPSIDINLFFAFHTIVKKES